MLQKIKYHIEKEKYHWHINFQDLEKAEMCFQSWCTNMKIIETCLEEYQIMIWKIRIEFALKIQKFKNFKKFMKEKLLNIITYVIS